MNINTYGLMAWLSICLALICPETTSVSGGIIDDFNDGDNIGWTQLDYTEGEPYGPATFDASSGAYHVASQGNHARSATDALISLWDESAIDSSFGDGYLQVQLRADNRDTVLGIAMRAGADDEGRPLGYVFSASANYGVLAIARYNGPTMNFIGPMPSVGFEPGSDWIFQAGASDDRLEFKAWRADRTEPRFPQITIRDSTFASGQIGVMTAQSGGSPNHAFGAVFDEVQFTFPTPDVPGDFDENGVLDLDDINLLIGEINSPTPRRWFDVDADDSVTPQDLNIWVHEMKNTWIGDANLDLEFNTADLVQVLAAGRYETREYAGWGEGDWNADGVFDTGDLVKALEDGGYERGSKADIQTVPEPMSVLLFLTGVIWNAVWCRPRQA